MKLQVRAAAAMLFVAVCGGNAAAVAAPSALQSALSSTLAGTRSTGVILDGNTGERLAVRGGAAAITRIAAPGSTLKPIFLAFALQRHLIDENYGILCRRQLRIGDHNVSCTQPLEENVFRAETALAYSCNSYFATLALRFTPQAAVSLLRDYGLETGTTEAPYEAAGFLANPTALADLQLLVLGLMGVAISPLQLAHAYFLLSKQLTSVPAVERGLVGSVDYGMAQDAMTAGVSLEGKTGTAGDPGQYATHGWFAGIARYHNQSIVLVIYVPRGNGADAASMAHRLLQRWRASE